MAPVVFEPEARYLPALTVAVHLLAVLSMTSTVGFGLYKSWQSLSPSQAVRSREAKRRRLVPLFAVLAALGFFGAVLSSTQYTTLSYQVWADQRGLEYPQSLFWRGLTGRDGGGSAPLHLRQWLSDTAIYKDAVEVVVEKSRRQWWGQQIDLAMVSWALLLAIEGHRRAIRFLWAYLALAQLVNLSFAQNLFYAAMLLTPAPIPKVNNALVTDRLVRVRGAVFPPKSPNWCPNPILVLGILVLNFLAIYLLPYAAETASFYLVLLSTRTLNFVLVAMPSVVPASWGTVHTHPHDPYGAYNTLFRVVASVSLLLHAKSTIISLLFNVPDSHYHRHSIRIPWDTAERSAWERGTTAFGRVLGSTSDHPVVAGVGRDVVISTLSLGLWAAVRALDSRDILLSVIPFLRTDKKFPSEAVARRVGKTAKTTATHTNDTHDGAAAGARRRGRPRKAKPDPEGLSGDGDEAYHPSEEMAVEAGDVLPTEELDWEAAALAWGLTAIGGLGCGSAGVFGGECISR